MRESRGRGSRRVGRVGTGSLNVTHGAMVVIVVALVRVRARHVVRRQTSGVTTRRGHAVAVVRVMSRAAVDVLALNLGRRLGEHRNITRAVVVVVLHRVGSGKRGVGMRR